jgi:hypothetical protein
MATAVASRSHELRKALQDVLTIQQQHAAARSMLRKRRQGDRVSLNMPLPASTESPEGNRLRKPFKIFALDIGPKGMGLIANRAIERKSAIHLSFAPLGLDEMVFPTCVVHCCELLPGIFRVGVEFDFNVTA